VLEFGDNDVDCEGDDEIVVFVGVGDVETVEELAVEKVEIGAIVKIVVLE
jgi:hypothetical protein